MCYMARKWSQLSFSVLVVKPRPERGSHWPWVTQLVGAGLYDASPSTGLKWWREVISRSGGHLNSWCQSPQPARKSCPDEYTGMHWANPWKVVIPPHPRWVSRCWLRLLEHLNAFPQGPHT